MVVPAPPGSSVAELPMVTVAPVSLLPSVPTMRLIFSSSVIAAITSSVEFDPR